MEQKSKEEIIAKLKEAFLDKNLECDGIACMGCWKDVVREAIKMIESTQSKNQANGGEGKGEDDQEYSDLLRRMEIRKKPETFCLNYGFAKFLNEKKKHVIDIGSKHSLDTYWYRDIHEAVDEYLLSILTPSIPSSKGAFSVEDVVNIHIEIMKQGLIGEGDRKWEEKYEPKIREVATEYLKSLTPSQPEVGREVEFAEWLNSKYYQDNNGEYRESDGDRTETHYLKELFQLFQSSTKTNKP